MRGATLPLLALAAALVEALVASPCALAQGAPAELSSTETVLKVTEQPEGSSGAGSAHRDVTGPGRSQTEGAEGTEGAAGGPDMGDSDRSLLGPGEAAPPPRRPRHRGVVLESTLGVLGFAGKFRHVAPPAYWIHAQLGVELLSWLMLFGESELALTDTSESQDPFLMRAFPIWGVGGGARVGGRLRDFGAFVEGNVGALTANVPHGALSNLGFKNAESLGLQVGARVGVEWFQRDRHFALTAQGGPRVAQGFSMASGGDLPLLWDTSVGLRYTF